MGRFSNALMRGMQVGNQRRNADMQQEEQGIRNAMLRRQMAEEDSNRNAMNASAIMQSPEYQTDEQSRNIMADPAYQSAMEDPDNRAFVESRMMSPEQRQSVNALNPTQRQAIKQQRTKELMTEFARPAFELQRKYMQLEQEDPKTAVPRMNEWYAPIRDMIRDRAGDPGIVPDSYNPAMVSKFLTDAGQLGLHRLDLQELGINKKAERTGGRGGTTSKTVQDVNHYMGTVNNKTGKKHTKEEATARVEFNNRIRKTDPNMAQKEIDAYWSQAKDPASSAASAPPEVMDALKSGKYKKVKKGGVLWTLDSKGNPIQVK